MKEYKLPTPMKAIRLKCLDCSNGQYSEVRFCGVGTCPIYPYRMGKRPKPIDWEKEAEKERKRAEKKQKKQAEETTQEETEQ